MSTCPPPKLTAVSFGGGQVDITSGKFVFNCTEAYEINNGKIGSPIKGATLIGDGPSILKEVSMVGNDMMLDPDLTSYHFQPLKLLLELMDHLRLV